MSGRAQLFIGRLHKDVKVKDLEDVFDKYGRLLRCDVKYGKGTGMAYAFVDYDDRRDAEDAIKYENGRELRGHNIVVEWARGPAYRPATYDECYRCHRSGHWARDCPDLRRGDRYHSRSRSTSRSRRRRSNSRSRTYRRSHRSSSRSPSRRRSRDRRSKSITKSRSRSYSSRHSRSKSNDRSPRNNSRGRRGRSDSKDRSSKEVNGKDSSVSPGRSKRKDHSSERDSKNHEKSRSRSR